MSLLEFHTETQLRERVKELHCLAQLGRTIDRVGTLDRLLQDAVELLPAAFQFPEEAARQALLSDPNEHLAICEFEVHHRDGHLIPIEIHARVLHDDDGQAVGFQGTARDIRERRQAMAALGDSEEQYRTMFETMAQGAVVHNAQGELISANPAAQRILGRPLEELKQIQGDDPVWKAIREDGTPFPWTEHPAMLALRTGRKANDTIMGVFNSVENGYRWIQVSAAPHFRSPLETPYQVYCTFEDVTELRRARAERQEADRMKGELLESV